MQQQLVLILFSLTILFSKNGKIKYGGEKVEKDKYVTIELLDRGFDSNAKLQYWNYSTGKWIEIDSKVFSTSNSTYKWKPSEEILSKKNLRIRLIDKDTKVIYMSPSYILAAGSSSGKQVFEAEGNNPSLSNFKIYPNPVKNNQINIISENDNVEILSLRIIDLSGLEVYEVSDFKAHSIYQLNLPNISKGVYIISIKTSESIETEKLIIE